MQRSLKSANRASKGPRVVGGLSQASSPDRPLRKPGSHSIYWWSIKVVCGVGLIAALFIGTFYHLATLFSAPTLMAQVMVLLGGGSSIWHYLKLKHNSLGVSGDISKPNTLETSHGLFRQVRHPMYACDLLSYSGLFLLFPTWPALSLLALAWVALIRQAQVEDRFVEQLFPDTFSDWQGQTKLILPFVY